MHAVMIHQPQIYSGEVHLINGIVTFTLALNHAILIPFADLTSSSPMVVVRLKRSDAAIYQVSSSATSSLASSSAATLP
jgi:hypothetical protein